LLANIFRYDPSSSEIKQRLRIVPVNEGSITTLRVPDLYRPRRWIPSKDIGYLAGIGSINLIAMRKLQLLGDWAMWLVIVGVLSFVFGILALVGLVALVRELIVERHHDAHPTEDERAAGTGDIVRPSSRRYVTTP
jgi:hypothetical protein